MKSILSVVAWDSLGDLVALVLCQDDDGLMQTFVARQTSLEAQTLLAGCSSVGVQQPKNQPSRLQDMDEMDHIESRTLLASCLMPVAACWIMLDPSSSCLADETLSGPVITPSPIRRVLVLSSRDSKMTILQQVLSFAWSTFR